MHQSILITGCTPGGIGYACAKALKKDGYVVFATARRAETVKALQDEGFHAFLLDVTDEQTITDTLEQILHITGGSLDVLFNNAGYGQPGAVEDITVATLKAQFETNVIGLHNLTRRVIPIMRHQGHGRIIQHSSVLGLISLRYRGAYNASKYAIEGLCDTLRLELMDENIHVCALNTGPIRSNFRANATRQFLQNVDMTHSVFKSDYQKEVLDREHKKDDGDIWTKDADAVVRCVQHAIKSKRPKPRYHITTATKLLAFFKRVLPTALMDKLLRNIQ